MILKFARVRKFKCIIDSETVPLESEVTSLVGKNESGKTAFLEALYRLNPIASSGRRDKFVELHDYPRRRRGPEKEQIASTVPIEAVFELENDDLKELEDKLGKGVLESREVTVATNYQNVRAFKVAINEKAVVTYLLNKHGLEPRIAKGCSTIGELREKLSGDTPRPDGVDIFLAAIKDVNAEKQINEILDRRLPKFLYFDQYSVMPGRFSIPYIQSTKESDLNPNERTALSLLRLANVNSAEFTENDYEARKAALETASVQISTEVFEFWSQNKDLRVYFDVDFKSGSEGGKQPPFLDVRIWNDRHQMSLNFNERSTGFVWFFSFLAYFSEFRNKKEKLIILLDEPGLSLHASAQADLLRFIGERLASKHQILYTTHSPFMIQPTELHRTRTVEDIKETGTRISVDVFTTSKDTIFPLQAALGYELAQTLFVSPNNLVVEGPSDMLYLQIVSEHLRSLGRTALDARWTLVPAGGVDKIPTFIALLGAQLNVAVVLDVASGGNQKVDSMVHRGILSVDKLFPLTEFTGGKEADVEDLFEADFYLSLVRQSGEATLKLEELKVGNRILKRIESTIGHVINHYTPASCLLRDQVKFLPKISEDTLGRFEKLFSRVNSALSTIQSAGAENLPKSIARRISKTKLSPSGQLSDFRIK